MGLVDKRGHGHIDGGSGHIQADFLVRSGQNELVGAHHGHQILRTGLHEESIQVVDDPHRVHTCQIDRGQKLRLLGVRRRGGAPGQGERTDSEEGGESVHGRSLLHVSMVKHKNYCM
ncbi:MAG TPA: hypothetical protein DEV68_08495 [Corynebacterium flavescens]|nr:hypothetical protein [Corynebacterium flavescens]